MARFRFACVLAAAALSLAACGAGSTAVPRAPDSGQTALSPNSHGNNGPVASVSSLAFTSLGASASQTFTVTVQYATKFSASSSNPSVATVKAATVQVVVIGPSGMTKSSSFIVTPVANGSATITVVDKKGNTAVVPVTVAPPGPISANPTSVTICPSSGPNACSSHSQTIAIAQSNFTGSFTEHDDCDATVAVVSGPSRAGSTETFTISGGSQTGTCRATFQGAGASTGVGIVVVPPGVNVDLHTH